MKEYDSGYVCVRYCLKHLIHESDYSHLRLNDSEKELLREHLADEYCLDYEGISRYVIE